MIIKEIADEINDHLFYGKNAIGVDYDSLGVCPFYNSRLDEYYFCACDVNMGVG